MYAKFTLCVHVTQYALACEQLEAMGWKRGRGGYWKGDTYLTTTFYV